MGIAAYARGSALTRRYIDSAARSVEFDLMEQLNALPKDETAPTPFGEIQFVPGHGGWWAQCPKSGYGFHYPSLRMAVRRWRVEIYGYQDGCWLARPMPRPDTLNTRNSPRNGPL